MFDIFNMLKKEAPTAPKQVTRDTIIGETIEEACEVHGVNCDELLEKLNTHLAAKKA